MKIFKMMDFPVNVGFFIILKLLLQRQELTKSFVECQTYLNNDLMGKKLKEQF